MPSRSDDELLRNPDDETQLRFQNDNETLGTTSNRSPPPWNVGDNLDGFILEKLLGSGSSGFVYRALDVKANRRCALKLLKHGSPDDLLRNKLGFRRMMSLDHPNLLRVDRIHQLGSYIALSMEEVEGRTFKQAMSEFKKWPLDQACEMLLKLLRQFASGLSLMHANGFIHRDIKPENLMVDVGGSGRVIDYGLVDSYDLDQPSFGARGFLLGTPHYFAPEVIWSQRYLPAGDIFSLGIVVLDALTALQRASGVDGEGLKRSENSQAADAERIVDAIDELHESVPSIIRETCREMLDRYPAERPTAVALARLGLPPGQKIPWADEEPIVGRDAEQQQAVEWVNSIFAGQISRLHLTGDSGVGKTRFLQEIIRYIDSKHWGQVFAARCRLREDQPLQAFDQICDAITHRYMKGDRDRIELDPVSVEILQAIFPVLQSVLSSSMELTPAGQSSERLDALEAASRLSESLRQVGPLFLVIDDSQWADRDSRSVLDRIQSAQCGIGLGIITVSRHRQDPQRIPAAKHIQLQPLKTAEAVTILAGSARKWSVQVSDIVLRKLARAAGGSPFRLRELADEFRPGGALHQIDSADDASIADVAPIDHLWRQRAERLSAEAKRTLPYIVTAGGRVSTQQLGQLTELSDSVDAAVSDLVRQRLVIDEATGGECITIFHDRVADELIKSLSEEAKREAHHAWAALLARQNNPEQLAGRIAGHFFAAGQPGRAVAHAILAAEDADRRVAKAEAGRWYAKVVNHVRGEEKIRQLRNAARCYRQADYPVQASRYYQQLSRLVDSDERIECLAMATAMLIRCGRFAQVREQLNELAVTLGLPRPKSLWKSRLATIAAVSRLAAHGRGAMLAKVSQGETTESPSPSASEAQSRRFDRHRQGLQLCMSLVRPMSLFDNQYATELSLAATRLALLHGDAVQRIHAVVSQSVFGCYSPGRRRIESEASLLMLKPHVQRIASHSASGDMWAGIAYSHALACRWDQVGQPVSAAVEHYLQVTGSHGFEIAHTRWIDLWADWFLGRWKTMKRVSDEMFRDATGRDDLFQQIVTMGAYGVGVWLARDKTAELNSLREHTEKTLADFGRGQIVHIFDWIAAIQIHLYQGQWDAAWEVHQTSGPLFQRPPCKNVQMIQVSRLMLGATIAMHQFHANGSKRWSDHMRHHIDLLRRERIGFTHAMAEYFDGIWWSLHARANGDPLHRDHAIEALQRAVDRCQERRLRPYQLAAQDALAELQSGQSSGLLRDRMLSCDVIQPERFQRLYTTSVS